MQYTKILNKDYKKSLGIDLSDKLDPKILSNKHLIVQGFWGPDLFNCVIGISTDINLVNIHLSGFTDCKCGILKSNGSIVLPFEFQEIIPYDQFIIATRKNLYELYRLNGTQLSGLCFNKFKEREDGVIELYTIDTWETGYLYSYYELSKDGTLTKTSSDGEDWSEKPNYDSLDAYEGDESNRWNTN